MRTEYTSCPLCAGTSTQLRIDRAKPVGRAPTDIEWRRCNSCLHVYTRYHWDDEGLAEMFSLAFENQVFGGELDTQRVLWSGIVDRVVTLLGSANGRWVDVGCGNGALVFTAAEYGFDAEGIDLRPIAVDRLKHIGIAASVHDAMTFDYAGASVVSLADVLEHIPYPATLLSRVRSQMNDDGALFVSMPNMDCITWRYLDAVKLNHYWTELEHHHNFTRERLARLLDDCGFEPAGYSPSSRYNCCMNMWAIAK